MLNDSHRKTHKEEQTLKRAERSNDATAHDILLALTAERDALKAEKLEDSKTMCELAQATIALKEDYDALLKERGALRGSIKKLQTMIMAAINSIEICDDVKTAVNTLKAALPKQAETAIKDDKK